MTNTDQLKIELRPTIPTIVNTLQSSSEETFQNEKLRPIIKLQHDLIISHFEYNLKQNCVKIDQLNKEQMKELIVKILKGNGRLQTELRGLVTALFTVEEYCQYLQSLSPINRRINNMVQQRIESNYL